ncbi:MAG: DNA-3-methyladenine glycosylase [Mariniblastus sp.]
MPQKNSLKPPNPLCKTFYARETKLVAKELLGMTLVSEMGGVRTSGKIVETEAYLPRGDSACHAAKSRTARTEVMFGEPGLAYVYPIHAKVCFNVVTEAREVGCAVLIRALEPTEGFEAMQNRRGLDDHNRLTTGPGCLCQALSINREINRHDLVVGNSIWIEPSIGCKPTKTTIVEPAANATDPCHGHTIMTTKRIGVTSAQNRLLRFCIKGNPFVSGPKYMRI